MSFRKGNNNTLTPEPDDVGSPWAIGGAEGGHKDIHPQLGSLDDFKHLLARAKEFGIDIALDIAFDWHEAVANHFSLAVSPDGKRVAYTGNDWSKDTWQDSKLYVMNIDGTNPRLVSGDWDRAPSQLKWAADGNTLYFKNVYIREL